MTKFDGVDEIHPVEQNSQDDSVLLENPDKAPEHLKDILETPDAHATSSADNGEVSLVGEPPIPPRGLLLVTHEPGSISAIQGSHIRGSGLKVSAAGDQEVDLLLRGTGRLRVQLGVNMPAKATHKVLHDEGLDSTETDLFEACDVVLYLGIIDILQDYNVIKKIEHTYKSLLFDPLSISAVEPKLYSKRFISFLEKVFLEQTCNGSRPLSRARVVRDTPSPKEDVQSVTDV
ncbi:Phosphatidylinositol 4-phosphate 5-kinase 7 [Acorus calamus]|uniref:1-phosphatidylinositol-4-phosphate 5-kinase n=1 Tax=Acorus calamus TaxID=4465 RepID=A0AAV9CGA0_ACOCL|nr:Phosphatidylinositol 4-phosphate 5-kinase 7 [Acorus calamus]